MKAFVLAAGEGRRLRPLTASMPKCLVPIRGTPLLAIWLQLLESHGVTSVLVNLHYFPDRVLEFLRSWPTSIAVHTVHEPQLLGSAGTVVANRRFVESDRTFLIVYADNLTNVDLTRFVRFHEGRTEPMTIGVVPTDRPGEKGTILIGPDGQVIDFAEKSPSPRSNLANAGIYAAGQDLFRMMPSAPPPGGVLDFGHDVLPQMVPHVAAYRIDEFLMDIGSPDAYERAQAEWPGLVR